MDPTYAGEGGQRSKPTGPGVEGGRGEDWLNDKDSLFSGSNPSGQSYELRWRGLKHRSSGQVPKVSQ